MRQSETIEEAFEKFRRGLDLEVLLPEWDGLTKRDKKTFREVLASCEELTRTLSVEAGVKSHRWSAAQWILEKGWHTRADARGEDGRDVERPSEYDDKMSGYSVYGALFMVLGEASPIWKAALLSCHETIRKRMRPRWPVDLARCRPDSEFDLWNGLVFWNDEICLNKEEAVAMLLDDDSVPAMMRPESRENL